MFIFRRITNSDSKLTFSTGDSVFNDINPDGTLGPYVNADIINRGDYFTYLLLRKNEDLSEIYAVLRYRLSNIEELLSELQVCKDIIFDFKELKSTYGSMKFQILYLSRVGILREKRNRHLSQFILNFSKVREGKSKFLVSSCRRFAFNWDDH
ncbi:MAG: hypothetical protein ACTSRI_21680 [Promethearchaeota archaeon]